MSHNMISSHGGENTTYELVDRSNEPHKNDIRIGVERAQTEDVLKRGSPVPLAPGAVSEWGMGWKTPAMMVVLYSLAFSTALAHCLFFMRLNRKPANTISQTYVSTISHLLGNVFRASLCGALAVAFAQHLWRVLRTNSVKISNIELLYTIRYNFFLLAHPGVVMTAPLLFLLSCLAWTIPLAVIYPPGALTVVPSPRIDFPDTLVPTFDPLHGAAGANITQMALSSESQSLGAFAESGGAWLYKSTRQPVLWIAKQALSNRQIATTTSPCGTNCTFSLEFTGPYVQCTDNVLNRSVTGDEFDSGVYAQYYFGGWEAIVLEADTNGLPFGTFSMDISRPLGEYYSGHQNTSYNDMLALETHQVSCTPGRASYTLQTSYANGLRELSYTTKYLGALQDLWNADTTQSPGNSSALADLNNNDFEAMNLYALTDSFVSAMAGNYPIRVSTVDPNSSTDEAAFKSGGTFKTSNGTTVPINATFWDFNNPNGNSAASLAPNSTMISETKFNLARDDFAAVGPNLTITQDLINEALANITLSTMYTLPMWNTSIPTQTTTFINIYSLTAPINLYLPYALCLALALPFLLLGFNSLRLNGVPAVDGGFVQILATTTGNKRLESVAAGGCLGGYENMPNELLNMKVRFGELNGVDGGEGVRRAGFGTEDQAMPLRKRVVYGRAGNGL